jgi:hypothetical protein
MPVYQNKALQDQIMRVATQGQQRSVNSKARQAAVAKAIGSTGQVAAKAYSANAAEVMKQAKELGISSPEEIAGLKKVMEISERTGLSVEEITGSPKLMEDLMNEAKGRRVKQDSLDESIGELSEMRRVKEEEIGTANTYKDVAEESVLDAELDSLVADEETRKLDRLAYKTGVGGTNQQTYIDKYREAADVGYDALAVRQGEEAFAEDVGSELSSLNQQKEDLSRRISSKEADRKANVMSPDRAAKLKALQSMGLTTDQLTAARRSISAKQKLDKLASSNLVGRDMVGRMASEGSRAGMKELAAQKAAKAAATMKRTDSEGKARSRAIGDMSKVIDRMAFRSDKDSADQMENYFVSLAETGIEQGLTPKQAGSLAGSLLDSKVNSLFEGINKELRADKRDTKKAATAVTEKKKAATLLNNRKVAIKNAQNGWSKDAAGLLEKNKRERDTIEHGRSKSNQPPIDLSKNALGFGQTPTEKKAEEKDSSKTESDTLKAARQRIKGLQGTTLGTKLGGYGGTTDPSGIAQGLIIHARENPTDYAEKLGIPKAEVDRYLKDAEILLGEAAAAISLDSGAPLPGVSKKISGDQYLNKFIK